MWIINKSTQYIPIWGNKYTFERVGNEEISVRVHIHYCYGQFGEETNTDKKHRLNQNKIDRLIKKYLNQY